MTFQPLYAAPGINKVDSAVASGEESGAGEGRIARSRYIDGKNVRFIAGFPEKIGGYEEVISDTMTGVPRGMRDWRDNLQNIRVAIGTNNHLYFYYPLLFTDITPLKSVVNGTLSNALSTTSGSTTVNIHHVAHGQKSGDYVGLSNSAPIGGLTLSGTYTDIIVIDADHYTITASSAANATTSNAGGTLTYIYYRITLTNPFTTIIGSSIVSVSHTANGCSPGDYVTIAGASAVGGVTPSGEFDIISTLTDSYTIDVGTLASSSTTGGGTPNFIYDIPSGFADSANAFGYGTGGYGENGYGTTGTASVHLAARTWSIARYGQQVLCNPAGGGIYVYDPTIGGRAYPLNNAPTQCLALFVTPERYVTAIGISGNSMQIAWPDQSDYTNWTSTATNTANSGRTLQGGSYLVGGLAVRDGVSMIFSNTTAFTHTYTSDDSIYATLTGGDGAGLISPLACVSLGGVAYWMSDADFWSWGGAAQALPTDDIRDYVFGTKDAIGNLNREQSDKCVAYTIRAKKSVRFCYPSSTSDEIDSYVDYHIDQNCWSIGRLEITTAIDQGLITNPLSCDASGLLYNQETGVDANGSALDAYVVQAVAQIGNGDQQYELFSYFPDFERITGNGALSPLIRSYPTDPDTVLGPYVVADDGSTPKLDLRTQARFVGYKYESNVIGGDFRLGAPQVDIQPGAARR